MGGRLEGRIALVTGSSSGIGAACARRFAEEGARVAGLDIQEPGGDAGRDWELATKSAPDSHFGLCDVRDEAGVQAAVAAAREALGPIDVLVNGAGVGGGGPVHLVEQEAWDHVVDINLKGTFLVSKHVLPHMLELGRGAIVHIASVEGIEGFEGGSAYNASKGGVVLLTRNMAIDYARRGIRTNAICPGFIDTPLLRGIMEMEALEPIRERIRDAHQLGRFGEAVEIANTALFLVSDEASFVNGVALPVDGGYTAGHRFGLGDVLGLGD